MSKIRKMPGAYSQAAPKGPNGENLCRWCRKEVRPPKRTFCGPECVHEWRLRTSSSYVRQCILKRDRGICAVCKLDCEALKKKLRKLYTVDRVAWQAEVIRLKIPKGRLHKSLFDCDHIVPVCEGGGFTGLGGDELSNYQVLCFWCHQAKSIAMMKERRAIKKAEGIKSKPRAKRKSKTKKTKRKK